MSNYNNTKATIAANVYTNHANQVTAEMVKTAINAVVDTIIAGGFLYKGVAIPTTNPGSPDANVAYIAATAGTYTNFGGLVVADGEVAVLKYNGSWSKEVTGAATAAQVSALGQEVSRLDNDVQGQNQEIADFEETITNQIDNFQPIVIEGNVTNAPDEEDITTDENDLLKFANRGTLHGMGYIILRRDKTFAEQVTKANTIYEIRYDFDLGGDAITLPSGAILKFCGGLVDNGELKGIYTAKLVAGPYRIFGSGITLSGNWRLDYALPEWFGCIPNTTSGVCAANAINKAFTLCRRVVLGAGEYNITSGQSINLTTGCELVGISEFDTKIINTTPASNSGTIVIGTEGGSVAQRVRRVKMCGFYLRVNKAVGVTKSSAIVVGAVSKADIANLVIVNENNHEAEFTTSELSAPYNVCNYGIKINGASEWVAFSGLRISSDICVYNTSLSIDFGTFDNVGCDAQSNNTNFGFASFAGSALYSNAKLNNICCATGLYGIYWDTDDKTNDPTSSLVISNLRVEQLRNATIGGVQVRTNIVLPFRASSTDQAQVVMSGVSLTQGNGIKISGTRTTYGSIRLLLDGVRVTGDAKSGDYLMDLTGTSGVYVSAKNSALYNGAQIVASETAYRISKVQLHGIKNTAYPEMLYNIEITPIFSSFYPSSAEPRIIAKGNREYTAHFECDVAAAAFLSAFVGDVVYPSSGSKVLGYSLEMKILSNNQIAFAKILAKYPYSDGANNALSASYSLIEHSGDDIIAMSNTASKVCFYSVNETTLSKVLSCRNNLSEDIHIIADITIFSSEKLS